MPSDRVELVKLCSTKEWSKAIRVLDSFISQSCVVQDLCNRAFCYSQLELHKHVIKDCDKALQLDPTLLQAYVLKGRAFSALGRKEDARLAWEKCYEFAVCQSTDLKQLLELEDLLATVRQSKHSNGDSHALVSTSSVLISDSEPQVHTGSSVGCTEKDKLSDEADLCNAASSVTEVQGKSSVAETNSVSSGKSSENKKSDLLSNGGYDPLNKFINNSDMYTESNGTSEPHALSVVLNKPNDKHEIHIKSSNKSDLHTYFADEAKKNKKFRVARISKNKSISVDFRLSRGIAQVNEGKYAQAISIFDQILKEDPLYPEALIGRGTAYAFQRKLDSAIVDFTEVIKSNPSAGEAWKRRGQARAALGESVEAIEDLTKALEFEPGSPDILHERGIVNFKFKDFNSAIKDLSACVKLDVDNKSAYTYLGLALASVGEYKRAEEIQMKAIQLDRSFLEAWAHLTQFYVDMANPTKALECIQQILQIDGRFAKAYQLRGSLLHGMGAHRKAIKDLSVALSIESSNIDCLYLRASCYHAIGEYGKANKDYNAVLELDLDTMEKFVLQCMAFYQNEINLYTASRINSEFCWFDIDRDIDPLFKEYWCKRLHPKNVCEKVFRQPALRDPVKKGKLRKQDFAVTKSKSALQQAADRIGNKIQYSCPGFLPDRRQHRMAGLAAIEIAQKVSKAWRSLHAERKNANKNNPKNSKKVRRKERSNYPSQNRGGACSTTSGSSETSTSYAVMEDRPYSGCIMSWQEVYALAVKWRQISEPCDPVVWVNKLSEEFNAGFGSNTPMILGQAKVVRYFPNYARTLDVLKAVMEKRKYVRNRKDQIIDLSKDGKLKENVLVKLVTAFFFQLLSTVKCGHANSYTVMQSESCSDLHRVVGDDFWLATWCNSTAFEGKQLEGTRITLLKPGENKYDFAIRTPCTPSRWEDFDAEMAMAWDALCNSYCGEAYGSTDFAMLEGVRDAILRMTYYWYNFMPLSRGSAAVGFVVLLGLFMAANMEFLGNIPQGVQVDWDAILNLDPPPFVESVKSWLYPSLKVTTAWKEYPDVASTFSTTGSVVAVLSSYDD